MRNGVKNLRSHRHLVEVVDYVKHCGGDEPKVTQNVHLHVDWLFAGQPMAITLPTSPRCVEQAVVRGKQAVRRAYREHGVEVRA